MEVNSFIKKQIDNHTVLGIKKIENDEMFLRNACELTDVDLFILQNSSSQQRRLEILNVRYLLKLLKIKTSITYKKRKPISSNGYISISHSEKFVSLIWSENKQYSIDIEELDGRIIRISKRAFNEFELSWAKNNPIKLNYLWNAKECIYKLSENKGLEFKTQIRLHNYSEIENSSIFKLFTENKTEFFKIFFDTFNNHTLAYAEKQV